jgi:hypothetical protein
MTQLDKIQFAASDGNKTTRRSFLATSAAASALSFFPLGSSSYAAPSGSSKLSAESPVVLGDTAIHPFHINIPQADLVDLRRRIGATRWPERETVSDVTQGVQLATMQKLANLWATLKRCRAAHRRYTA